MLIPIEHEYENSPRQYAQGDMMKVRRVAGGGFS